MTQPAKIPGPSLLGQFVHELTAHGLTERQVQSHLVFLRLWQRHVRPLRLLDATPDHLTSFLRRLRQTEAPRAEVLYAAEAIENFYAFVVDRQPDFPAREAWRERLAEPLSPRQLKLWQSFADRLTGPLRRLAPPWVKWPEQRMDGHDA
ncbi:MAG: hypothetical protein VKN33_02110 [Candidatus Sericytochromatia bacterium]|nr:hypothetical protein [Candidatus Sericytochromatia bacterium]